MLDDDFHEPLERLCNGILVPLVRENLDAKRGAQHELRERKVDIGCRVENRSKLSAHDAIIERRPLVEVLKPHFNSSAGVDSERPNRRPPAPRWEGGGSRRRTERESPATRDPLIYKP